MKLTWEIKGDKQPIGIHRNEKQFKNNIFDLENNDTVYLFSDGYIDQFGGEKFRKFKMNKFKQLMPKIQNVSLKEQKNVISESFNRWKGTCDQTDDVLIVGIKI